MISRALLLVGACVGCTITYPVGWHNRVEPGAVIPPTPGVWYGSVPLSWDLPGGERILIDVRKDAVISGMGLYHAEIDFVATYDGSPESVRCVSEPVGPTVPATRFGCWSEDRAVTFWLAPEQDCPARHVSHVSTLTTPGCWQGQLTVGSEQVRLSHGYFESTGSPVGYVSWVSDRGEPLLAANIVSGGAVELFDIDGAPASAPLRRSLVLMTMAFSWWEHAANPS